MMYWVQTKYNLNNILTPEQIMKKCKENGVKQIIVGDEGPFSWIEFESLKETYDVQIIYALEKRKGESTFLWLLKGDVLKNAAIVEQMNDRKQFHHHRDIIPVYIPKENKKGEMYHQGIIEWMKNTFKEFYVMKNQENESEVNKSPILKEHSLYVHRVRYLDISDVEINQIRRVLNGTKEDKPNYQLIMKPEKFLKREIIQTKNIISSFKSFIHLSKNGKDNRKKMHYWDPSEFERIKLPNDWSRFFIGEVNLPKDPLEQKKIMKLCQLSGIGFNCKYKNNHKALHQLKKELSVVVDLGFYEYFLMVKHFVEFSKRKNIGVSSRGSVVGSVLAYCLGITEIDPMLYGLKFERFLNKSRGESPDIDIEVQASRIDEVISHIKKYYGEENVAKIITFSNYGLKNAINSVRKYFGVKEKIEESLPRFFVSLTEFLQTKECENYLANLRVKGFEHIFELAVRLADAPQTMSIHTAGIVISQELNQVPLLKKDGQNIIPFTKSGNQIEKLGFVKFDFLPSKIMDVMKEVNDLVGEPVKIRPNDKRTYELLSSDRTYGLFQMKSYTIRKFSEQVKPNQISEIMDILALVRPGPKDKFDDYLKNKRVKREFSEQLGNELSNIIKETNGILLYQEQVMEISEVWAGFSKEESDTFRSIVSSKDKEKMGSMKSLFIEKSLKMNRDQSLTMRIYDSIESFASYGFNKSHAAIYAHKTYETAYLKAHYPKEYLIALANSSMKEKDKLELTLADIKKWGIKLYGPKLDKEYYKFTKTKDGILIPVLGIKGIGLNEINKISDGKLNSVKTIKDLENEKTITNIVKEKLIKVGCFDYIGDRWDILKVIRKDKKEFSVNKSREQKAELYKKWERELLRIS